MSKTNESQWAKAKALYEKGESLRGIESITGIPYKTINNRAKKNGWEKGSLAQLISDTVRVKTEFGTLETVQQEVVSNAVDELIRHKVFFNNATIKNVSVMMGKLNDYTTIAEHRIVQAALLAGKETVLGKMPETAVQVNVSSQKSVVQMTRQELEILARG